MEKLRRLQNAKVSFYFYREYGGKEVDVVMEDYKKNYTVLEIKIDKGSIRDIFPLPYTAEIATMQTYFKKIAKILEDK